MIDVLIIGAGHAGAQAALMLRKLGYAGAVALAGAEADPPYERPPLSKTYLAGGEPFERMIMRPKEAWAELNIDCLPGRKIVAVDPAAHEARCENGERISYGKMIWAAGGTPRRLPAPGGDLAGIHVIRTRADVDAIRAGLDGAKDIVIIGGGYIGLEAASVLVGMGKRVCVLEAQERLLSRVAGPDLSAFYEREHRGRGVDIRLGAEIEAIVEKGGRPAGVCLAGGEALPADLVIVGIGIAPDVEPLIAAGAEGALGGVKVDEFCRTSLPDIYAAGDCAAHANRYAGGAVIRLESVQNAHDQASAAAASIAGDPKPYDAVPWFWSDQYDLKLQTAGLSTGHDAAVLRGDPDSRSFSVVYLKDGRVIALDCVNATRDYAQGRRLVATGGACDLKTLADPAAPLFKPPARNG
ncbi:NAD(P)/FAD-dependent oxidoreductase [Hyphococcus luteus]|uniref:Pyridine nucleotide-disulfide oxidoreductase n=1 Tax=Hyphococcus luteus TaxID=2058213 RepID=A0A2S7K4F0_9PROT|nr:FAD-dependent oxidoreductase [Marinicaulis flavus]PQA87384.1 pyridine nucleotide-disulfide oxidoreductase [Marinicaulis flavus]